MPDPVTTAAAQLPPDVATLTSLGLYTAIAVGLIWVAHIGLDRALGFGLKYGTRFYDTHLGRV